MTTRQQALVDEYLNNLDQAARHLPSDRRADLLASIEEHIHAATSQGDGSEGHLRTVLDRLGPPGDIAAAAQDASAKTEPPATRSTGQELAAVLFLSIGSLLLPVIGWIIGVILLWSSTLWTRKDKALGTLVWPGGLGSFFLLGAFGPSQVCSGGESIESDGTVTLLAETCEGFALPLWVGIPVMLALLIGPIVVAAVLYRRARQRASA